MFGSPQWVNNGVFKFPALHAFPVRFGVLSGVKSLPNKNKIHHLGIEDIDAPILSWTEGYHQWWIPQMGKLWSSNHETKTEASMNKNIIHIGLDVDDTQYHGAAFNQDSGEVIDFKCRPTLTGLKDRNFLSYWRYIGVRTPQARK